jgi:DNA-binding CsgD family transcriptional regulator
LDSLSSREREVLQLVAEGGTSAEIAMRLGISPRTVEMHRRNLVRKLDVSGQAALARYAIQRGLGGPLD